MPRFVRPAWLAVSVDDRPERGTGPRTRDGFVSARLTLRTAAGIVSEPIRFDAGGIGPDGSARLALTIPAGFAVELDGRPLASTDTIGTRLTVRPLDDRAAAAEPEPEPETSYNGWRNRDTWLAALWISNEERPYNEARAIVADTTRTRDERHLALRRLAVATVRDPFDPERVAWADVAASFSDGPST